MKLSKLLQYEQSFNIINSQTWMFWFTDHAVQMIEACMKHKVSASMCTCVSCCKNFHILIWWILQRKKSIRPHLTMINFYTAYWHASKSKTIIKLKTTLYYLLQNHKWDVDWSRNGIKVRIKNNPLQTCSRGTVEVPVKQE